MSPKKTDLEHNVLTISHNSFYVKTILRKKIKKIFTLRKEDEGYRPKIQKAKSYTFLHLL